MADEFFYKFNPDAPEVGPIDSKTLKQLAGSGSIQPESLLRRGTGDWVTASTVKGLFAAGGNASPPEATPVEPPEAKPAGPVPIATPATSSSPPEAIPVAPPTAESGGGMSFPDLSQPKAAGDVPSGLDSLKVAPKKPGSKPAKKGSAPAAKKGAAPTAAKVEAPNVAAPKSEASKLDLPSVGAPKAEAPKVEAPQVTAPKVDAPKAEPVAAAKPAGEAANPYASDPPAGRMAPRRKKTGGIGSLFNFDVMIAPTVIKTLFFVIAGLFSLVYLVATGISLIAAIFSGDILTIAVAAGMALVGFVVLLIYIIILRVSAEVSLVFFTINDNVRDMRDMMADQQGTIE